MIASAPGKLFLMGEYAVLEGGTAVLIPAPARAKAELLPADAASTVTTMTTEATKLSTSDALEQAPLLAAVVNELGCNDQLRGHQLRLDSSEFFKDGQKLGFGSSAAITVALVKLFAPSLDTAACLERAIACHLRFQGGKGSGADIALSVFDEPIGYRIGETPKPVNLPDHIEILAIWTGHAASTTAFITRLQAWRRSNEVQYVFYIDKLKTIADDFARGLDAEGPELMSQVTEYDQTLQALSEESGANFYSEAHVALRNEIQLGNLAYKPSGAGGGDFGLAFSTDAHAMAELAERLTRKGIYTVKLTEQ